MKKILFLFVSLFIISQFSYAGVSQQILTLQGISSITFPDPNTNEALVEPNINEFTTSSDDGGDIGTSHNTISFYANDQTSSQTVDWVKNEMTASESISWKDVNMLTNKGGNVKPDELSFALKGTLSFTQNQDRFQCNNIIFGQAKNGSYKPWYVFTNIDNINDTLLNYQENNSIIIACTNVADSAGSAIYFRLVPGGNDSTFNVSAIDTASVASTTNVICFKATAQRDLTILDFSNSVVNVSPGENYENTINVQDNCIKVFANQLNSNEVKNWVETQMTSSGIQWTKYNMCSALTKGLVPDQLELAFKGNLVFNYAGVKYTCNNLIFGKGEQSWNDVHPQDWWAFTNVNSQFIKGSNIGISCTNVQGTPTNFFITQNAMEDGNTFNITSMIKQCKQVKGGLGSCIPSTPSIPGGGGGDVPPVE